MKQLLYFASFIAILFLSYRTSLFRTYILSIFASTLLIISYGRLFSYETILFLFIINVIPLITEEFKRDFRGRKEGLRDKFEEVKNAYTLLTDKDKQKLESNLELEKRLNQVLSLYEVSKEMSTCLTFEDIFNVVSSTLKRSFRFKICRAVLLKDSESIESAYQIEIGHKINKVMPDEFDRGVVNVIFEKKAPITLSCEDDSNEFRRLSAIKNFKALVCVPLFAEEKIVGILYIEDLLRNYFENFIILANQFAIQFQKVFLYNRVQELSITDSLTSLSTRRYFLERFREEVRRSMRRKASVSFLMLDIDHFKETNDRYGHLVGDVLLKEVSMILKANLREIDIVGRYGGEEFGIVLAGIGRAQALQAAERIRSSIEKATFKAYDEVLSSTVSIGLSAFPDDGVDVDGLIESADRALYKAKETGRNRVC